MNSLAETFILLHCCTDTSTVSLAHSEPFKRVIYITICILKQKYHSEPETSIFLCLICREAAIVKEWGMQNLPPNYHSTSQIQFKWNVKWFLLFPLNLHKIRQILWIKTNYLLWAVGTDFYIIQKISTPILFISYYLFHGETLWIRANYLLSLGDLSSTLFRIWYIDTYYSIFNLCSPCSPFPSLFFFLKVISGVRVGDSGRIAFGFFPERELLLCQLSNWHAKYWTISANQYSN